MATQGLRYADGPYRESAAIASSAFSKGDVLMLGSNSSLSRLNTLVTSGVTIMGVALADSTESRSDQKVPYILALDDTAFYSDCTPGTQFSPGDQRDLEFDTTNRFRVATSTNTVRVKIAQDGGTQDVRGQSGKSTVKVYFIDGSDNIEYV